MIFITHVSNDGKVWFTYNGKLKANIMKFEILCMDNKESEKSWKLKRLILAFQANDILWSEEISVAKCYAHW